MEKVIRNQYINKINKLFDVFPIVALVGPRQCGKTTLAMEMGCEHHFDLENPRDLSRLDDPQLALESLQGRIVIDEIQLKKEIFPLLRYLVDHPQVNQQFLILGSASRDLIEHSSEKLSGRIAFQELAPFSKEELLQVDFKNFWQKGGFPASVLQSESKSVLWREAYVKSFLERDLSLLGFNLSPVLMRKFWTMLAHSQGQVVNYSELARSLQVSDSTVKKYIYILEATFMIRILKPWHSNLKKREVKNPKIYIRDTGLFHSLLDISNHDALQKHVKLGASFESVVVEEFFRQFNLQEQHSFFWKLHSGAELDLFIQRENKKIGVEIKYSSAPKSTKSMLSALESLALDELIVVIPGEDSYLLKKNIRVVGINSPLFGKIVEA